MTGSDYMLDRMAAKANPTNAILIHPRREGQAPVDHPRRGLPAAE